jgi:cryptochrome 2
MPCLALLQAWRQGRTGYPLVDAAMREVWGTGWMHNRMRVVAASFLVKNLLLPWQWGLKHYWDALLDADLECDALGWQYVAGCMAGGWRLGPAAVVGE